MHLMYCDENLTEEKITMPIKPYADSSEQNKQPILEVLQSQFAHSKHVLEIGSGTGQHGAWLPAFMPHLSWQCSELAENLAGIQLWLDEAGLSNTPPAIELNINQTGWPSLIIDAVFSANTFHIVSWPEVKKCFAGIGNLLPATGKFALYGPFIYGGKHTSQSNIQFDQWLKARDPKSGVRDVDDLNHLAGEQNMALIDDIEMPVNNHILVWQKR
jgi:hypothetical protein